ncbi:MAG TPA: hypothetical protein VN702_17800 [Acetobacteraceae bacterium]|nr:hypothetical protein [Acetobacteraceae bacterium]
MSDPLPRARLLLEAHHQGYTDIADGDDYIMITAASVMWARMVVAESNKEIV